MNKKIQALALGLVFASSAALAGESLNEADKCILAPFNKMASDLSRETGNVPGLKFSYTLTFTPQTVQEIIESCEKSTGVSAEKYGDANNFIYKNENFVFQVK
jgi:hypothetical protein